MNVPVFKAINGVAHVNGMLDEIMIVFSKYSPLLFVAALATFYLYGVYSNDKRFRYTAVDAFAITLMSLFLGFVIGIFYYEPRPFVTDHVNLLTPHAPDASFPSDHSLGTMSIALGINNNHKSIWDNLDYLIFTRRCLKSLCRRSLSNGCAWKYYKCVILKAKNEIFYFNGFWLFFRKPTFKHINLNYFILFPLTIAS